ncbi:hypothetical protein [Rhizobium rosettiformans]|uniref:hypothetical protein n=1 Tax=Rhizobium rosettiformans TaxID=1368430 RepID=UPI002863D5C2|nr:hypothetical protein [Rhizobium rosettiformans]MDR7030550.1 hypothetical protein [Rhizobium rosettiformans]MDR7066585.1 hypothetical protein [Rhizobium rosettiformans]
MLHHTDDTIIQTALDKLDDSSDDVRRVVTDLVMSGFNDVDELVELAGIARDSILSLRQDTPAATATHPG